MPTIASRPPFLRSLGVTAVLALALVGAVPGAAQAADEIPGGTTPGAAVAWPMPGLNGSFGATNIGMPGVGLYNSGYGMLPYFSRVAWYTFTAYASGPLSVVTSLSSADYDTTLELWTSDGAFLAANDDYLGCCNSRVDATLVGGTTYLLGLGAWFGRGTTVITTAFTPQPPTAPRDLQVVAGDTAAVVTWNPPLDPSGDLLGYTLLCTPDGGTEVACGQSLAPAPGESPSTTYILTGLTNGTAYTVRVTADNAIGASPSAGPVAFMPMVQTSVDILIGSPTVVSGQLFDVVVTVHTSDGSTAIGTIDVSVDGTPVVGTDFGGTWLRSGLSLLVGAREFVATYSGSVTMAASSATLSLTVVKRSQTVDFTALPAGLTYAGAPVTLVASSTFGMRVTFSASGACTVDGDVLTLSGVGDCTVIAAQDGDSETEPASASQTVSVGLRPQVLTLDELAPMVYGQTPVAIVAISSVGLPVTVVAEGACALVDDELTTTGVGACVVTATQAGDALNAPAEAVVRTAVVAKRPDTITLSTLPALVRGSASIPVSATSLYDLPVTIVATGACVYAGGFVSMMDVGTCTVTATSDGDGVTEPASAASSATVVAEPASVLAQVVGQVGDAVTASNGRASGTRLRPGTALILTVYSTPQGVGSIPARLDGTAMATGTLPALAEGTHHLVARGTALDGTVVEDSLAFGVDGDGIIVWIGTAPNLAATGADVQDAGMLAALWLITGAGLLLMRRNLLRRRTSAVA